MKFGFVFPKADIFKAIECAIEAEESVGGMAFSSGNLQWH
jgi:hypothetical protein